MTGCKLIAAFRGENNLFKIGVYQDYSTTQKLNIGQRGYGTYCLPTTFTFVCNGSWGLGDKQTRGV